MDDPLSHKGYKFPLHLSSSPSLSDPQIDCSELISALIKNTEFFKETFTTSDELNTFAQLSTPSFRYEVLKYGSIITDFQDLESKLCIVLKGQVTLLQKKLQKPAETIFKNQKLRALLFKKNTLSSSPTHPAHSGSLEFPESEQNGASLTWLSSIDETNKATTRHRRNIAKIGTMPPLDYIQENDYQISPTHATKSIKHLSIGTLTSIKTKRVKIIANPQVPLGMIRREGLRVNFDEEDESPSITKTNDTCSLVIKDEQPLQQQNEAKFLPSANLSKENLTFIDDLITLNPDKFDQSPSSNKTTLSPTTTYEAGDCFGCPLAKKDPNCEGEITGVSSEEAHLICISGKDYLSAFNTVMDQRAVKIGMFSQIFSQGREELIKRFCRYFQHKTFLKGEVIYNQNDPSNELYLIFKGEIKLSKEASVSYSNTKASSHSIFAEVNRRIKLPITYLKEAQFFGEESVIIEPLRQYTAIANSTDLEVFCLPNATKISRDRRFEEVFEQIREQAQEKFHWRKNRVSTLIENKQKGLKLQQITNINLASLNVPTSGSMDFQRAQPVKSLTSIANLHDSLQGAGSIPELALEKSVSNSRANNSSSAQDPSIIKDLDTYKKKYSRRVQVLYPEVSRSTIRARKYDTETARKQLESISLRDIRGFNIRKELEDTTSRSKKSNESRSNSPTMKKIFISPHLKPINEVINLAMSSTTTKSFALDSSKLTETRNETLRDFSPIRKTLAMSSTTTKSFALDPRDAVIKLPSETRRTETLQDLSPIIKAMTITKSFALDSKDTVIKFPSETRRNETTLQDFSPIRKTLAMSSTTTKSFALDPRETMIKLPSDTRRTETMQDLSPIMNSSPSPKKLTCYELKWFEESPNLSSSKVYEKIRLQKMLDSPDSQTRSYRLRNALKSNKEYSKSCVNIHTQAMYKSNQIKALK